MFYCALITQPVLIVETQRSSLKDTNSRKSSTPFYQTAVVSYITGPEDIDVLYANVPITKTTHSVSNPRRYLHLPFTMSSGI